MAFKERKQPGAPEFNLSGIPPGFHTQVSGILSLAKEKGATREQLDQITASAGQLVEKCKGFPPAAGYLLSQAYFMANSKGPAEAIKNISEVLMPNSSHYVYAATSLTEEAFAHIPRRTTPEILDSPEFLYGLFTTVSMVEQMDSKPWSATLVLNSILAKPSFEPSMLETIQLALEKSMNSEIALQAISTALGSLFDRKSDYELISANLRLISMLCRNCGSPESVSKALHEVAQIMPEDVMQADAFLHIARAAKEDAGKAFMALRQNGGASRSFYDGQSRGSTPLSFSERRSEFMLQIATFYKEGEKLARSLGARHEDAEVCLNFAYALMNLGREKTEKLYREAGIEYFMRYKVDTLNEAYSNIMGRNKEKPVLLAVLNKNDPNGAFYQEGNSLAGLTKHYRVIIREVDSEGSFNTSLEQTHSKYGKIGTVLIGGHGTPEDILLGKEDEKGKLDLTDREELRHLRKFLGAKPLIVLLSCSTGKDDKAIGAMLSKAWDATLFAPKVPSSRTSYLLSREGEISSVEYNVDASRFSLGKIELEKVYSKPAR